MPTTAKPKLDAALIEVLQRIDAKTVTCEDFNRLIMAAMVESSPEAVRNRTRRRTLRNPTQSHTEPETGHQQLKLPKLADRVQPKVKPENQQSHGRSKVGHRHSERTQARQDDGPDFLLPPRFQASMEFIMKHRGQPITEEILAAVPDKIALRAIATKLLGRSSNDREWLYTLIQKLG